MFMLGVSSISAIHAVYPRILQGTSRQSCAEDSSIENSLHQ
jgi:hypothetical protein